MNEKVFECKDKQFLIFKGAHVFKCKQIMSVCMLGCIMWTV
jgi:hypothetical protein